MVGAVTPRAAPMTETTEARVVVSWTGAGEPILLTLYDTDGAVVSVPLSPVRALELAKDLTEPAVQWIKVSQWSDSWPG